MPFLPNDAEVSRTLQDAGIAIIPGIRLEDAVETAMWAHAAPPVIFEGYVRRVYAEGRVYGCTHAAPLAWSETITWEDEPSLVPAPATPARMPPASLAWSEQITWDEDEAPPTPAVTAGDEIVADFDRALSQLSML
ncbi:MAG: hypothetical protein HGA45_41970 [Chloroflexales bacterium]|nr:hypothetical protein [Chloroflexales bacterium]